MGGRRGSQGGEDENRLGAWCRERHGAGAVLVVAANRARVGRRMDNERADCRVDGGQRHGTAGDTPKHKPKGHEQGSKGRMSASADR